MLIEPADRLAFAMYLAPHYPARVVRLALAGQRHDLTQHWARDSHAATLAVQRARAHAALARELVHAEDMVVDGLASG